MIQNRQIINRLRDHLVTAQAKRPGYSLRAFARDLGISPALLSCILNNRLPITRKTALRVIDRLALPPDVSRGILDGYKQPHASAKKQELRSDDDYSQLNTDQFKVISDWYYFAILSLAETADFSSDPQSIARRLGITPLMVSDALATLARLGLIAIDGRGRISLTQEKFIAHSGTPNAYFRKHHAQVLERAAAALEEVPIDNRGQFNFTVATNPNLLPEVMRRVTKFRRSMAKLMESAEQKTEVYSMAIQVFPLSRPDGRKKLSKAHPMTKQGRDDAHPH